MATSAFALLRPTPLFFFPSSLSTNKPSPHSPHSTKALNIYSDLYAPSLRRGQPPTPSQRDSETPHLDRSSFSRTFNIAALRIPASQCSPLEHRLRGHLLNWPRIRNVARVPGDDLDPQIRNLLRNADTETDSNTETMSAVMYREKLAKEFNCRGFLNFRNLARMSRPKKKKKKREVGERGSVKGRERERDYAVVEVMGESEGKEDDMMRSLVGGEFSGGGWRGSTRLLLLDERYADRGLEELPEAVKVAVIYCLISFLSLGFCEIDTMLGFRVHSCVVCEEV